MDLEASKAHERGVIGIWIDIESPGEVADGSFPFDVEAIDFVFEVGDIAGIADNGGAILDKFILAEGAGGHERMGRDRLNFMSRGFR